MFVKKHKSSLSAVFWLVFAAAAAVRVPLWLISHGSTEKFHRNDSAEYLNLAANLMDHGIFSSSTSPPWVPNLQRTPFYPFFIALACLPSGKVETLPVIWVQLLLGILTAVMTAHLAYLIAEDHVAAVSAGLFVAFDLAFLEFNFTLLSETVFSLLILCGFYLLYHQSRGQSKIWSFGAGLLLSLATLTRPIGLLLCLPAAVLSYSRGSRHDLRRKLSIVLLIVAGSFVLPAFWCARNYKAAGVWTLTTAWGSASLFFRAANMEALRTGQPIHEHRKTLLQMLEQREPRIFHRGRAAQKLAWEVIAAHPVVFAKSMALDVVKIFWGLSLYNLAHLGSSRTFLRSEIAALESNRKSGDWIGPPSRFIVGRYPALWALAILHILMMSALYLGAALGLKALWLRNLRAEAGALAVITAYLLAFSLAVDGNYRYRVPALPYLAILAGIGWGNLRRLKSSRSRDVHEGDLRSGV